MSTEKLNNPSARFAKIASMGEVLFHTTDFAVLWGIHDKNTLYTTLKRYCQKGLLFRVYKGLYSIVPIEKLSPPLLGAKALHSYCYISTESILTQEGIIVQSIPYTTYVSSFSKTFQIGTQHYKSRQLDTKFLLNPLGVYENNGVLFATPTRAVADILYFSPRFYFDHAQAISWKEVKQLQEELNYPLTPNRYDDLA